MSTLKVVLLAVLLVPAGLCIVLAFRYWARTVDHLRPGASSVTPFLSWRRDDPGNYTAEGKRALALSVRYRLLAFALGSVAILVNVFLT